ncbi:MAG: TetR/AcrR family transcriptional regulator [Marmoricola sp.]
MARSPASELVLEAAAAAFSELGFHGTSTREIAARAGMSPSWLYVHYSSKEALLFEISRGGHERVLATLRRAASEGVTPTERLESAVHAFVLSHARGHVRARVVNYEIAALSPGHVAEIVALRRDMVKVMRSVIDAGLRTGDFTTPDPSMTCLAIMSLGVDVSRWYRDDGRWSPEDVAAHYRDLALRMVGTTGMTTP